MKMTKQLTNGSILKSAIVLAGVISLTGCLGGDNDYTPEPGVDNEAPSAVSVSLTTQTEVPITDQLSGSDPEGQALTYTLISQPQLGSITVDASGGYTYQPFDEVTGSDMFTYVVKDTLGLEASATVSITIEALQVSYLNYSRLAFSAEESDSPLLLNGRVYIQDSTDTSDYQDLIDMD